MRELEEERRCKQKVCLVKTLKAKELKEGLWLEPRKARISSLFYNNREQQRDLITKIMNETAS